jgi:hypothetical protein
MTLLPDERPLQPDAPPGQPTGQIPIAVPRRQPLLGLILLLAVAGLAAGITLALGTGRPRWPAAVAFAMAACLPGAIFGWILARMPVREPAQAVAGGLASVALRMTLPLAALAWLSTGGQGLRDAGAAGLLVAFYLTLWATDLLLHIVDGKAGAGGSRAPH